MNDLSHPNAAITDPAAFSGLAVKTSNIIGTKVVNRQNEDLGKVEEVVIDVFNGRIGYLVLSFGGFLGMGPTVFPDLSAATNEDNPCAPTIPQIITSASFMRAKRSMPSE